MPFCLISLILLVLFLLSFFTDLIFKSSQQAIPEFHVINNTDRSFLLRGYSDSSILMPAGTRVSYYNKPWMKKELTRENFIRKNMQKPDQAALMGCLPVLQHSFDWGMITMPGEAGWRKIYFARVDKENNEVKRNSLIFIIHLLWILKVFFFIVLVESVLGIFYTSLRYKFFYIVVALILNFPVIYLSSDFGTLIQYTPDLFFSVPFWTIHPTSYFIRFSVPLGTIFLLSLLIIRKRCSLGKSV